MPCDVLPTTGRPNRLESGLGSYLRALGVRSQDAEDLEAASFQRPGLPLREGILYDFCEVFARSSESNLARRAAA